METSQLHCCREPISIDLVRVSKHQQNTEAYKCQCLSSKLIVSKRPWRQCGSPLGQVTVNVVVRCCEDEPVLNSQWCEKLSFIPLTWIEDNLGEYLFDVTKEWQTERRQLLSSIVFTTVTRCLFVVFNCRHLIFFKRKNLWNPIEATSQLQGWDVRSVWTFEFDIQQTSNQAILSPSLWTGHLVTVDERLWLLWQRFPPAADGALPQWRIGSKAKCRHFKNFENSLLEDKRVVPKGLEGKDNRRDFKPSYSQSVPLVKPQVVHSAILKDVYGGVSCQRCISDWTLMHIDFLSKQEERNDRKLLLTMPLKCPTHTERLWLLWQRFPPAVAAAAADGALPLWRLGSKAKCRYFKNFENLLLEDKRVVPKGLEYEKLWSQILSFLLKQFFISADATRQQDSEMKKEDLTMFRYKDFCSVLLLLYNVALVSPAPLFSLTPLLSFPVCSHHSNQIGAACGVLGLTE
ncbi:hypothetical protein FOCC_FOCC014204 [Frankliniella occidentalis]|nr:hypothetical protein FOCC_FOCC014204 [Frankliniella occidentalis]